MRPSICGVFLAGVLFALLSAGSAQAITCYVVYDRSDNAIFQDTYPPIDLSDRGTAERSAMYKRGEHLIVMESDRCPTIQFFTGTGGTAALTVDQVVGGMRASAISVSSGSGASGRTSAAGKTAPAKAPASTSKPSATK
jgi:hypothetical protein